MMFPNIMEFEFGTCMKNFSDQAAKGFVWFWDMKTVSNQVAYYMKWKGPHLWNVILQFRKVSNMTAHFKLLDL